MHATLTSSNLCVLLVHTDPMSSQLQLDSISVSGKTQSSSSGEKRAEPAKALAVSSSRADRNETRVSSSAQEHRYGGVHKLLLSSVCRQP